MTSIETAYPRPKNQFQQYEGHGRLRMQQQEIVRLEKRLRTCRSFTQRVDENLKPLMEYRSNTQNCAAKIPENEIKIDHLESRKDKKTKQSHLPFDSPPLKPRRQVQRTRKKATISSKAALKAVVEKKQPNRMTVPNKLRVKENSNLKSQFQSKSRGSSIQKIKASTHTTKREQKAGTKTRQRLQRLTEQLIRNPPNEDEHEMKEQS